MVPDGIQRGPHDPVDKPVDPAAVAGVRILVIEADDALGNALRRALARAGFDALRMAGSHGFGQGRGAQEIAGDALLAFWYVLPECAEYCDRLQVFRLAVPKSEIRAWFGKTVANICKARHRAVERHEKKMEKVGAHIASVLCCVAIIGGFPTACAPLQLSPPQWTVTRHLLVDGRKEDLVPFDRVLVGRNGLLAVPQIEDRRLVIFDSAGRRLSNVGRVGAGPGEIEVLRRFGWVGDSLWVFDRGMRLSLFRLDGRFLEQRDLVEPFFAATSQRQRTYLAMSRPEAVYAGGRGMLVRTSPVRGIPVDCPCWVTITNAGEIIRVVTESPSSRSYSSAVGSSSASVSVPFAWGDFQGTSPDGGAVGWVFSNREDRDQGRFRVTVVRSSGDTSINKTYAAELVNIPGSTVAAAVTARTQSLRAAGASAAEFRVLIPASYPPYEGILMGRDGTIWIKLRQKEGRVPWLVLDERGAPIGRISLPTSVRPSEADQLHIWATEEDSDGFRSVVLFSISRQR